MQEHAKAAGATYMMENGTMVVFIENAKEEIGRLARDFFALFMHNRI